MHAAPYVSLVALSPRHPLDSTQKCDGLYGGSTCGIVTLYGQCPVTSWSTDALAASYLDHVVQAACRSRRYTQVAVTMRLS